MAELILEKRGEIFKPVQDECIEVFKTIKQGAIFFDNFESKKAIEDGNLYRVKFSKMRKPELHRKFFVMLQAVFRNQDKYAHWDFPTFLREIKIGLGHTKDWIMDDGRIFFELLSISFAKMDEHEFRIFYSRTIDLILARFINGTPEDIERMTLEVLQYG